jgi:hypothetical protein
MPATIAETVTGWFNDRIATAAVARDTDAYNQVFTALPDLIARLDPPAPEAEPAPEPAPQSDPTPSDPAPSA